MRIHAKTLLAVVAVAAFVLLAVRYVNYRRHEKVETGKFALYYDNAIQALRAKTIALSRKLAQNGTYDPSLIVAPVEPVMTDIPPAGDGRDVTLQGISWNPDMPLVFIDDRVYKAGDRISCGIIEKVQPNSILVSDAAGAIKEIPLVKE